MLKKMTPKSQAKNKTPFPQYPFLTIFNSKKVSCRQIYNLIILYTLNWYSLFVRFKYMIKIYNHNLLKISINNHTLLCMHINNHAL